MTSEENAQPKSNSTSSLDPNDWSNFRSLTHHMVDESINFLEGIRERPVYNIVPMSSDVFNSLNEPLPQTGQGLEKVCNDFLKLVLPYPSGNIHPRYWGWAAGGGNVGTIISNLMIATMNSNATGCTQSSTLVERQVLQWCRQIFNFPETFGGLIVSGTTMATIVALNIARNQALGDNRRVRLEGIIGGPRLVGYASSETHFSSARAFELLGLGRNSLRTIPVNDDYTMNIDELEKSVLNDLETGYVPFCVIGNAGTVNTGSIDNLSLLKDFALKYKLWFHVDGAIGAFSILDNEMKPYLIGIEYADTLAFDFHKWLHVPLDAGGLLIRDKKYQLETFTLDATYITPRKLVDTYEVYYKFGLEVSRSFRALNIWYTIKEHGTEKLGNKINDNRKQAQYLASLLSQYKWIRIHRPITLHIVCFRIEPDNWTDQEKINQLNDDIIMDIQQSGIAVLSSALLNHRLHMRCCFMNHRTNYDDCHVFVNCLMNTAEKYLSE